MFYEGHSNARQVHPNTRRVPKSFVLQEGQNRLRRNGRQPDANYETFRKGIENPNPAIAANVMIGLTKLTSYLLDQQIRQLEQAFLKEGGLRERMTRARLSERAKQQRGR